MSRTASWGGADAKGRPERPPASTRDAPQPQAKLSKFDWLDQRQQRDQDPGRGSAFGRSRDAQDKGRDTDKDRNDRER